MKTAEDGPCGDASKHMNRLSQGSVFAQGEVRSAVIVKVHVTVQQMVQVTLVENNDVVQTVASDRADRPLAKTILPG